MEKQIFPDHLDDFQNDEKVGREHRWRTGTLDKIQVVQVEKEDEEEEDVRARIVILSRSNGERKREMSGFRAHARNGG